MPEILFSFEVVIALYALITLFISFLILFIFKNKKAQADLFQSLLTLKELQTEKDYLHKSVDLLNSELAELNAKQTDLEKEIFKLSKVEGQFIQQTEQLTNLKSQLEYKEQTNNKNQDQILELETQLVEVREQLEYEQKASIEKISLLENAKKQMSDEFSVLANNIFEQKQQQFTKSSQATIEASLKPMQGVLNDFKLRVETVHKEDLEGRASISAQLKQLQSLNSQMSEEAQNLTQALKGDSKTQGNWGELILERLLERSGLSEGIEFEREKSFVDDNGKRLRPDVIVNMPDNKHVIIDSKVSLADYERALNAEDKGQKIQFIKSHLNSLKRHISALADKRYDHLEQINAPDFVLMFIPVEGAYLMAIEADSRVFEDAFEKRVAVVTPTTLFTTLKTIEQLWRYERQSENTVKLIKRAAEVHDKFVGFIETFEKVGTQFETANNSYKKAKKQLVEGNGNLVRQAEMLKDLAGKTKKEIPSHLLDEAQGTKLESKQ